MRILHYKLINIFCFLHTKQENMSKNILFNCAIIIFLSLFLVTYVGMSFLQLFSNFHIWLILNLSHLILQKEKNNLSHL